MVNILRDPQNSPHPTQPHLIIAKYIYMIYNYVYRYMLYINEFLVSKETVVLRRWERSKQKFGVIKRVDKG